jgi:SPRY domain
MFKKSAAPAAAAGGYTIAKSLRFRASASAFLNRTPASTGNQQKLTISVWLKRSALGTAYDWMWYGNDTGGGANHAFFIVDGGTLRAASNNSGSTQLELKSTSQYQDPASWYHMVLAIDTTQATASNRARMYVNGVEVTSFTTATYPSQNTNLNFNLNTASYIGKYTLGPNYSDDYLAEYYFIDGQQLAPTSFGSFSGTGGVWQPIKYTGTYGTNGFYLKFTDTSSTAALGTDYSGNSNTWTVNNISLTAGSTYDSMTDVPTLTSATVANYCVMNPLTYSTSGYTLSNGNLRLAGTTGTTLGWNSYGTMAYPSTGKYYFEVTYISTSPGGMICGIYLASALSWGGTTGNANSNGYGYYSYDGTKFVNGTQSAYGATWTAGDVIGVAFDVGAGTITFYKNNTSQGTAATGITGTYLPWIRPTSDNTLAGSVCAANFGQQGFVYTPPTGYVALNTYNLSTPTIAQGNQYMDATLFTSTGTTQTVTNAGSFKPDLVWTKSRSTTDGNALNNSVIGAGYYLLSYSTAAQTSSPNFLTSFNTNGFSLGTANYYNGQSIIGWQWQAGQGSSSSNTDGSITSTVSKSTTAGFSVVSYTGTGANATVGHGLGAALQFLIVKNTTDTGGYNWRVWHTALSGTQLLYLNTTDATVTNAAIWNSTTPTSSVFSLGTNGGVNASGNGFIAYCWTAVPGFSAFGSYTGNGSSNGPFVYTGFRPKWLMIKRTDAADSWVIEDSVRNPYNTDTQYLLADSNAAEGTVALRNLLSNGFQMAATAQNVNGGTYIYAAFAENPTKFALAR